MPFHERTVEPRLLCRLKVEGEERRHGAVLFASLDEVSARALAVLLRQLSDVSRHASNIFRSVELQTALVFQRSSRIQQRLDVLHSAVCQLNPKRVQIRKCAQLLGSPVVDFIKLNRVECFGDVRIK